MATENVVSKKYRILSDVVNKVWDVISFFTLAKDVETTNGNNLETTCGSITGITSSLTSTSTTMAASASAIKQLNDKIADLNSNLINIEVLQTYSHSGTASETYTFTKDIKNGLVIFSAMNSTSDANWYVGKNTVTSSSSKGNISQIDEGEANYNTYRTCTSIFTLSNLKKGESIVIKNANTCRITVLQLN